MRNKYFFALLLASLLLPATVFAEQITITVKGMVCSFCAQGIKKTFSKNANVKEIKVDLDNKLVEIETHEGSSIGDDELRRTITNAGYDVVNIERGKHA